MRDSECMCSGSGTGYPMGGPEIPLPGQLCKQAAVGVTWIFAILLAALFAGLTESVRAQSASLQADFAFLFACKQNDQTTMEGQIEKFLSDEGFKVLNQARTNRKRGAPSFGVLVFGLDEKRRIITVNALPPREGRYAASLITPPPTHRSAALEDAFLKFVADQLGCETYQVSRNENAADMLDAYDRHLKIIQYI